MEEKTLFSEMIGYGEVYNFCVSKGWLPEKRFLNVLQQKSLVARFLKGNPDKKKILGEIQKETGIRFRGKK